MPNWYTSEIIIDGTNEEISEILSRYFTPCISERNPKAFGVMLDFNKVIPMPEMLDKICVGVCKIDGVTTSRWIEENGGKRKLNEAEEAIVAEHDSWLDWSVTNWGTKWRCTDQSWMVHSEGQIEGEIETAWSPPIGIFRAIQDAFPDVTIQVEGRDEGEDVMEVVVW